MAVRATGPILIDGRLDESGWTGASSVTAFAQLQPSVGEPASNIGLVGT